MPAIARMNGNELGNDHDHRPMPQEQILAELDARFGDPNVGAVTQQQPITEFRADHVAEHAAEKRGGRRRHDNFDDVKLVRPAGNNRADDQRRLAGQRKPDAFQTDEARDDEQAVRVDEMGDGVHKSRIRIPSLYTGFYGKRTP